MKKFLALTLLIVAAGSLRSEIPPVVGTNVIGFVGITAGGGTNSIIAVPFEACMGEGSGMLADLVATNGLTSAADVGSAAEADQLIVLTNGTTLVYCYYYYKTGMGWDPITTVQLMPNGATQELNPPAADSFPVARGLGFWIKRVASANSTVYVKGQVSDAKQSTQIDTGLNLVGISDAEPVTLNASGIDWSGAYGGMSGRNDDCDWIRVNNVNYYFFTKPEGWPEAYDALHNKWITKDYAVANVTISSGQGFWYSRRTTPGPFTFKPHGN